MLNSPFDQTVKSAIATIVNQKVSSGNNLFGRRRLPGQQHAAAAGGSAHQNCDTFYNFVPKQMWEMIQQPSVAYHLKVQSVARLMERLGLVYASEGACAHVAATFC
eukprot:2808110-Pyramimonas_sp.AAC.1